ncbi:hypothetical protein B0A48_10100 [Cryoendolithus antarcticus]|uniref:DNA-directed RNA polymerase I subunit rpa49 n=1 Tax=Cryoendolithus antarcticus TaxID=1507870 RepID=A0A1V8SW79_9PEZI|nr:hypothetical protein B0A48_10100 [Cryoendolithus antarcticus]
MTQTVEKKRKRQSNAVQTPSKKVDTGILKVTHSSTTDPNARPIIATTPGCTAPSIPFEAYRNDSSILLHSTKHPRLDYTALPTPAKSPLTHYIAVYDPTTQTLDFTPAQHTTLRSTLRSETQQVENSNRERTIGKQREILGETFGTKKAKKAIASKTVNAITKGGNAQGKPNDVETAILGSVAEKAAHIKTEEEEAEAALAAKPIPMPNLKAERVEDVYALDILIPPSDQRLVQIKDWQDNALADIPMDFSNRMTAFRVSEIAKAGEYTKLKALGYLNALLEFHEALAPAGRGGKKVPKKEVLVKKMSTYPETLIDSVRRRFTPGNELNKFQQDYLYTHICALALYVDNFTVEMSNLKDDLKLENKQLAQYFSELGCRVSPPTEKEREVWKMTKAMASATKVAKLKLPLEFPRARAGRRR